MSTWFPAMEHLQYHRFWPVFTPVLYFRTIIKNTFDSAKFLVLRQSLGTRLIATISGSQMGNAANH